MKKIDLMEGLDIVKPKDDEWSILDKESNFVGKIKEYTDYSRKRF